MAPKGAQSYVLLKKTHFFIIHICIYVCIKQICMYVRIYKGTRANCMNVVKLHVCLWCMFGFVMRSISLFCRCYFRIVMPENRNHCECEYVYVYVCICIDLHLCLYCFCWCFYVCIRIPQFFASCIHSAVHGNGNKLKYFNTSAIHLAFCYLYEYNMYVCISW